MFVVQTTEVIKLGNFFEILSQFIQLPVLLPVKMGLHERSNLTHTKTHTQKVRFSKKCIVLTMVRVTTMLTMPTVPLVHSADS